MGESIGLNLQDEIIAELTIELKKDPSFNANLLEIKVKNAIREVRMKRNYKAVSYTEEQIEEDLYNYFPAIKSIALYDYNQIGSEGEASHSENSISRTWVSRDSLLDGVHAFVKIF